MVSGIHRTTNKCTLCQELTFEPTSSCRLFSTSVSLDACFSVFSLFDVQCMHGKYDLGTIEESEHSIWHVLTIGRNQSSHKIS